MTDNAPGGVQPRIGDWRPVTDRVYRLVAEPAGVNIGLVVGDDGALLIDTGSTPEQGAEIRAAVAGVTDRPLLAVVVTHDHFDHAFGLAAFADLETIGHESLLETLKSDRTATAARRLGVDPADLVLPRSAIGVADAVDLGGGRVAEVTHLGVGHTAGDLVVTVTDPAAEDFPGVVVTGDLVESAEAPWFGPDSSPDQWSWAVDRLYTMTRPGTIVVPGHGDPRDRDFVREQRDLLDGVRMEIERLARSGVAEDEALAAGEWPFPAEHVAGGIAPGYAEVRAAVDKESGSGGRPTLPLA
jgi:glyoxylase-like metal-dependent hydrolase (beta-lactamase superfamily II)